MDEIVEKSWHFDESAKQTASPQGEYELIPASAKDTQKVIGFYQHHPVPGYEIASVKVIYNPGMNREFSLRMKRLNQRKDNPAFKSKWSSESEPEWREKTHQLFEAMAAPYADSDYPGVKLLPLWHGTKPEILDSIFSAGYANLATTDSGFFGKGLYGAHEAEYSYRVYSNGALILNWVASFSAYPVIDGDMPKLQEKGNYQNYDSHFVPVVPRNPSNSDESVYYPCKPQQLHTYTEMVVFESSSCLPRYLVELEATLPKQLQADVDKPIEAPKQETEKVEKTEKKEAVVVGGIHNFYQQPKGGAKGFPNIPKKQEEQKDVNSSRSDPNHEGEPGSKENCLMM